MALDLALTTNNDSFLIISDSLSALKILYSRKITHHILADIHDKHTYLIRSEMKNIIFVWVPSHVGIRGNEVVDRAAKAALLLPVSLYPLQTISFGDIYSQVKNYIQVLWKKRWSEQTYNKLFCVLSELDASRSSSKIRREDVILTRLRIGHTNFTHSFILSRNDAPWCIPCDCLITVKHILMECSDLIEIRNKYYVVESLKALFSNVSPVKIINFLKEINVYNKI